MMMTNLRTHAAHIAFVLMCLIPHTPAAQEVADLWTPAAAGDLVTLRERLATGADPNVREPAGQATPLMMAALFGETAAAQVLLDHKAGIDLHQQGRLDRPAHGRLPRPRLDHETPVRAGRGPAP